MGKEIENALELGEGQRIEFKQKLPSDIGNTICAFANSEGGKIYVGILDKGADKVSRVVGINGVEDATRKAKQAGENCDPSVPVQARKIPVKKKRYVLVLEVDKVRVNTSYKNRVYKREGSQNRVVPVSEIEHSVRDEIRVSFDKEPCNEFDYKTDFDEEKFQFFLNKSDSSAARGDIKNILRSLGVAESSRKQVIIRNAGAMFFAKDLGKLHSHILISCTRLRGTGNEHITDTKRFDKDLLSSVEGAMSFLKEHLNLGYEFPADSMRRVEVLEIHQNALREALVNAVVHRDYSNKREHISVKVYDDRVEITNPGGYMPGMDSENFREFSQRRNPIIADLMYKAGYVEQEATGISRMEALTKGAGLPVRFIIDSYHWRVCFPRKNYRDEKTINRNFNFGDRSISSRKASRLSETLYSIHANSFAKEDFARSQGVSLRTIVEDLKYLRDRELIIFEGGTQTGRYIVTDKFLLTNDTGLSPTSMEIAKMFVNASKTCSRDSSSLSFKQLTDSVSVKQTEFMDAIHELESYGVVGLYLLPGQRDPEYMWAETALFAEFDHFWMPWDPRKDAKTISDDMLKKENRKATPEQMAKSYKWKSRRYIPAIHILKGYASRISPNQKHTQHLKFELPEFTRHSWDRGKAAAQDFLRYVRSSMKKESECREVVMLMCLRSIVSYLSHELYIEILNESRKNNGVYLASSQEEVRKVNFFQYLQKLASELNNKESEYSKGK